MADKPKIRSTHRYPIKTKAEVQAAMATIRSQREAAPTHDEIGRVLKAAGRFGISVAEQADGTGIERRHIYARHPDAKPAGS